jgi:hypothetical protein
VVELVTIFDPRCHLFSYLSPESRIPAGHPLRAIKGHVEAALTAVSKELDALYSHTGRACANGWWTRMWRAGSSTPWRGLPGTGAVER